VSLAELLVHEVTLQRPVLTKDASGGSSRSFADVDTYTCSIQPLSYKEQARWGARQLFVTHVLYFDADRGIRRGDRLYQAATGKYYVVLSYQDQAGQAELYAAYAREQLS